MSAGPATIEFSRAGRGALQVAAAQVFAPTAGTSALKKKPSSTASQAAPVLIALMADWKTERQEIMTAITAIKRDVAGLARQLNKLSNVNPTRAATLSTLGIEGIEIRKPISVTIEQDGDSFIANFYEANLSAAGDTIPKALGGLQNLIADAFEDLENEPLEKLGKSMKKQKRILQEMLCRTS